MLFIPLNAAVGVFRVPLITILVMLACVLVYLGQSSNEAEILERASSFCNQKPSRIWKLTLEGVQGGSSPQHCFDMLWSIHTADDPDALMHEYAEKGPAFAGLDAAASTSYKLRLISRQYHSFAAFVPRSETHALWYHPHSWDPVTMLTSVLAHGGWGHLAGNLFFFFAFAVTVEGIIGSVLFALVLVALALGTNVFYSLASVGLDNALPTVGLSGVVMGVMTLFAYFVPTARIRCFFWFIVIVRIFLIPAWILVLWYVGWDLYDLLAGDRPGVNLIAHLSGALLGLLIGLVVFHGRKRRLKDELAAIAARPKSRARHY